MPRTQLYDPQSSPRARRRHPIYLSPYRNKDVGASYKLDMKIQWVYFLMLRWLH